MHVVWIVTIRIEPRTQNHLLYFKFYYKDAKLSPWLYLYGREQSYFIKKEINEYELSV